MKPRPLWTSRLAAAWQRRPIVWLAGVRRAEKTTLARMLPSTVYLNCDPPSAIRRLEDPVLFFRSIPRGRNIVVSPGIVEAYDRRVGSVVVRVTGCRDLT